MIDDCSGVVGYSCGRCDYLSEATYKQTSTAHDQELKAGNRAKADSKA